MSNAPPPISIEDLLRERAWIRGLARAIAPTVAADVEQETWLTALRRPPGEGPRLRGWLRRVVRSRAVDGARSKQRRASREAAVRPQATAPSPDLLIEQAEAQGAVARGVATLPEPYRIVVLLRYFQGMSAQEIAVHLDVPVATVRTRLHRAHGHLRERLQSQLGGEWRRGLLLLGADPASHVWSAASAALKGGLVMTATQKLIVACGIALLALGGGMVGAWFLQPGDDGAEADPISVRNVDAPTSAEAAPVLRGVATDETDVRSEIASLRAEVLELKTALEAATKSLRALDPSQIDHLTKAMPALLAEIMRQNTTYAVSALRNFTSAHAQIQATGKIDRDGDGTGEFGGFMEMTGAIEGRMDRKMMPPVLSGRFSKLTEHGEAQAKGYLFRFFLPDRTGAGVGEPQEGYTRDGPVDADLAETTWCCYAWPIEHGVTGSRTFFMNQGGDTFWTDDAKYSGSGKGPAADAAFRGAGAITGQVAAGGIGRDGNTWKR